ncbi:hypothetical protein TBR22_A40340 [Luteitalea sp. TBR-22]|uniref:beta-galactosidase n=1 Tax=Luteitalea sp. TBR-22 TaxID=2802971 RepID=UPI001AF672FA|nr:alpha-amylase family protein [Luteitalea sp. TBR-22]BCS34808.1 hypothetical protein TBR22_A40340 [Luteitalea sp. TBR-22]
MRRVLLLCLALGVMTLTLRPSARTPAPPARVLPMAVWYGGGKARAPMLERDARQKKEAWRADVQQIKALGFTTIRAWIDWASGEPVERQYQFETLDVLLELAEEEGLTLVLQVYMDSAPGWIGRRHPDSLFVSSNGQAITPESSPGYCRDHDGVRDADVAFYAALASRAARSKAFLGFDLWSEPHVVNWATPTWIANPEFCFCVHTKARFRAWLQRKYGSVEALNRAWYRHFTSFDEVEPSRLSTILSFTDYLDWKAFIVDKLGEDLKDRADAVRKAAPGVVITSHAAGVGLFASPHHWEGQADDWTMARQVDYYGTSFYPKHSALVDRDVQWRGALLDFTRSFGYDQGRQGFWIGELQGGFGTIGVNVSPTVTAGDLRIWTWSALARGARGISYYAWYPMSTGYEAGGFGLNQLDGTITDRARAAGAIAKVVAANADLLLEARPVRAEVAIVYNPLAHFVGGRQRAAAYGGPQGEVVGIERDSLLGAYRALFGRNVPIDYVHANHVTAESLSAYKLVIFPYPVMAPDSVAAPLRAYVEQGGALVAEARLAWSNEKGVASDRIPGLGLWEVMGAREVAVQTATGGKTQLTWSGLASDLPGLQAGDVLPGRWYEETLEPLFGRARVVATLPGGAAGAVLSTHGRGKTLLLGSYVSAAYQSTPTAAAERFHAGLLAWAGVTPPVEVTGGPFEVRLLTRGSETLAFVLNHGRAPARGTVVVGVQGRATQVSDLATGTALEARIDRARVSVELEVPAEDARVLRIR